MVTSPSPLNAIWATHEGLDRCITKSFANEAPAVAIKGLGDCVAIYQILGRACS